MDAGWISIPNYEGYFCNRQGQISSRKKKQYKLLTIKSVTKQTVVLTVNGTSSYYDVHNLVALAFLPNPEGCKFVKHSNAESWDNRPENLEWTSEEVDYYSLRHSEKKMKEIVDNFSEWRTLEAYPRYYFHPDGTVMSTITKVTPLKQIMNPKPSVVLYKINGEKDNKGMIQIAKLIALAFVPNPMGYSEINYLDGDFMNIKASNLAWDEESSTEHRDLNKETEDTDMWKPIEGYPRFLISRQGELVSRKLKKYALIKQREGEGWTTYRIRVDDIAEDMLTISVQQLLGLAFIPNTENHKFVAPRNGDLQNYDLDNLYWCSNPNGLPNVQWVDIKGFPNHEVSGLGIRNKYSKLLMKPVYREGGDYPVVTILNDEGVLKCKYIHLLIARNLIPNPDGYPVVNHKDGDHHNYNIDNLEWCSHSQNLQHAHDTGLRDGSTSVTMIPTGKEEWKQVGICPNYEVSDS